MNGFERSILQQKLRMATVADMHEVFSTMAGFVSTTMLEEAVQLLQAELSRRALPR